MPPPKGSKKKPSTPQPFFTPPDIYSTLRLRPSPSTDVPPSSDLLFKLCTLVAVIAALPLLPAFCAIYFISPLPPNVGFRTFVLSRYVRMVLDFSSVLRAPEDEQAQRHIPSRVSKKCDAYAVHIETIRDIPIAPEALMRGLPIPVDGAAGAAGPEGTEALSAENVWRGVTAVSRPAFIISPVAGPGSKLRPEAGRAAARANKGEKIVIWMHGGGYVGGHPLVVDFPLKIVRDTGVRMIAVQYRKCLTNSTAFPAPLLDALAAWHYATATLGFPPHCVLLAGYSAGGNLALSLANHLANLSTPTRILTPGGLSLCSPWVDLTMSFPSISGPVDYLSKSWLERDAASAGRHYHPRSLAHPFFSPAFAPSGFWNWAAFTRCPVFVNYGVNEAFKDEIEALISGMHRDGVSVDVCADPAGGVHVAPVLPIAMFSESYKAHAAGTNRVLAQMRKGGT